MSVAAELTGVGPEVMAHAPEDRGAILRRSAIIALIAFLTLIDLFGAQALLPTLVETYGVSPAAMGFAVNASTIGMALASLVIAVFARRINPAKGITMCLTLLAFPTIALAFTDDLTTFTLLRVVQGVFMAAAFTLTLTYLSEVCTVTAVSGAMAAYITGNVASNLFGRLLASGLVDHYGVSGSFIGFAVLNLLGGLVAWSYFRAKPDGEATANGSSVIEAWKDHLSNRQLLQMLAIGFILLFVFVATFTYANFVLASEVFGLPQMKIGLVYFVFAPAILTTPIAARAVRSIGASRAFQIGIAASVIGLALLLTTWLPAFLAGLTLIGAGLFFAQSVATASIGRIVNHDRAAANGLYLASYYAGGISGAFVIGQVFTQSGWAVAVAVLIGLTALAALFGRAMPRAHS